MRRLLCAVLGALLFLAPANAINLYPEASQNVTFTAGGAASINTDAAIITTTSLTTAIGASQTFTVASPAIDGTSLVFVSVANGTNSAGTPELTTVTPANNGIVTIVIKNTHAANAFNGTLVLSVLIFN